MAYENLDINPAPDVVYGRGRELPSNPGWEQLMPEQKVETARGVLEALSDEGLTPKEVDQTVAGFVQEVVSDRPDSDKYPEAVNEATTLGILEVAEEGQQPETAASLGAVPAGDLEEGFAVAAAGGVSPEALTEVAGEIDAAEADIKRRAVEWLEQRIVETEEKDPWSFDDSAENSTMTVRQLRIDDEVPTELQQAIAAELALLDPQMLVDNAQSFQGISTEVADRLAIGGVVQAHSMFEGVTADYIISRIDQDEVGSKPADFSALPDNIQNTIAAHLYDKDGSVDLYRFSSLSEDLAQSIINRADIDEVSRYLDRFEIGEDMRRKIQELSGRSMVQSREYIEHFPEIDHTKLALRQVENIRHDTAEADIEAAFGGLSSLGSEAMEALVDRVQAIEQQAERGIDKRVVFGQIERFSELDDDAARQLAEILPEREEYWALKDISEHGDVFTGETGQNLAQNATYIMGIKNPILSGNVARTARKLGPDVLIADTETLKQEIYYQELGSFSGRFEIINSGHELEFSEQMIDTAQQLHRRLDMIGGSVRPDTVMRYLDVRQDASELLQQADQVARLVEKIAHSRSSEISSFAEAIVPMVLDAENPQAEFDQIEQLFLDGDMPTALVRLEVATTLGWLTEEGAAYCSPVLAAHQESGQILDVIRQDLIGASMASNNRSLRRLLESTGVNGGEEALARSGIDDPQRLLAKMNEMIEAADRRGRKLAQEGLFALEDGDLVKGVLSADKMSWLPNIMQTGSLAKEYLGDAASSDNTPLDTDLGLVRGEYGSVDEAIGHNMARSYGDMYFVLKNREDRWSRGAEDTDRLELLDHGGEHRGIRTGFGMAEVDFMVVNQRMDAKRRHQINWEIVKNGFYIPVVDQESGELVFTSEQYDVMHSRLAGAAEYGSDTYEFSSRLDDGIDQAALDSVRQNQERVRVQQRAVLDELAAVMPFGENISLIDTGSTGRATNIPGDGDFDLMALVDPAVLRDQESMHALRQALQEKYAAAEEVVVTGDGNLRIKGAQVEGLDSPVDIDVSFAPRTNKIEHTTEQSLSQRLQVIEAQDPERHQQVLANIVRAKQLLKEARVYKGARSVEGDGGLGGVGVENWILQHGGSLEEAAQSFLEAAEGRSYSEFAAVYAVLDPGQNHYKLINGEYPYDNFVIDNMSEAGYIKMRQVCQEIVGTHQKSDQTTAH